MAQVKRRRRRTNRGLVKFLVILLVAVLLLGTFFTLSVTVLFNIEGITVTGKSRYSHEEIIKASGVLKGTNMNLLDTDAAELRVCTQLPYIGTAEISRKYPDTIEIKVSECKADCVYTTPKGYALAWGDKVLEEVKDRPEDLPLITAKLSSYHVGGTIELAKGMNEAVDKVMAASKKVKMKGITEIDVENVSDITVTCDDKIVLQIGTAENIDKKFSNAVKIIEVQREKYGDSVEGYVNLRYLTGDANQSYFTRESISKE